MLGSWVFLAVVAIGLFVAFAGLHFARSLALGVGGFALVGAGAIAGGLVIVRDWRRLGLRYRIVGAGLLVSGIYVLGVIAKWAIVTGGEV